MPMINADLDINILSAEGLTDRIHAERPVHGSAQGRDDPGRRRYGG